MGLPDAIRSRQLVPRQIGSKDYFRVAGYSPGTLYFTSP
jgi:hypothetical protein